MQRPAQRVGVGVVCFVLAGAVATARAGDTPMDPEGDNAASRTLPLGTTAKVTNVETGKTAVVTIQDRGPYVDGRIVDLSPGTAKKIGLTRRKGITKVVVAPIAVPLPNGKVKEGNAAHEPADQPDQLPVHDAGPKVVRESEPVDCSNRPDHCIRATSVARPSPGGQLRAFW